MQASDLFTASDISINQISLKGHSEHEGRQIAMNFMNSLKPSNNND